MVVVSQEEVQQIFTKSGLPSAEFNEEHACVFRVDGDKNIQVTYNETCETLDFFAEVGILPEYQREICSNYLLKSNTEWLLTKGTTLAQKGTRKILLEYRLPLLNFSQEIFEHTLENFIQQVDIWKEHLQTFGHGKIPEALKNLQRV